MLKQCSVALFNPKGLFMMSQKVRNPGLQTSLQPKSMHPNVAAPKTNMPFDENQIVAPELVGSHHLRYAEIMRGYYGRVGKNRTTLKKMAPKVTNKMSTYRWLKREEHSLRDRSNITAGLEEHGLTYREFSKKRHLQELDLQNGTLNTLMKREPLAFRCLAEVIRSDNLIAYDRYPAVKADREKLGRYAQIRAEKYAMNNPLPTRARLQDPSWRQIPYMQGRQYDTNFHPKHPVFTIDWKV